MIDCPTGGIKARKEPPSQQKIWDPYGCDLVTTGLQYGTHLGNPDLTHLVYVGLTWGPLGPVGTHLAFAPWAPSGPHVGNVGSSHLGTIWVLSGSHLNHMGVIWVPRHPPCTLSGPVLGIIWAIISIQSQLARRSIITQTMQILQVKLVVSQNILHQQQTFGNEDRKNEG